MTREIDRDPIRERCLNEVLDLCARHPHFIGREMSHLDRAGAERFARIYADYLKVFSGSLGQSRKPGYLDLDLEKWKGEEPYKRYVAMEMHRAGEIMALHRFIAAFLEKTPEKIKDGPRLDFGSRSCFFARMQNADSEYGNLRYDEQKGYILKRPTESSDITTLRKPWYSTDIPLEKALPTHGTEASREKTPGFIEMGADHKIPFDIKFKVISLNMVLHHVDLANLEATLKSVYDALDSDGVLIVLEDFIGLNAIDLTRNAYIKGIDDLFYPDALGNQRPIMEWKSELKKTGFVEINKRICPGTFSTRNVVGLPVQEAFLVMKKA